MGKRTALFGMTRTGKSNTVKKIIQATVEISSKSKYKSAADIPEGENLLDPFDDNTGAPKLPVGQIIFDINGEYANPNLQDEGTAIFDIYKSQTERYSTLKKEGFRVLKVNFYKEIETGFELIKGVFSSAGLSNGYIENFLSVDLSQPENFNGFSSESQRYLRKIAAYKCCLYKAGYPFKKSEIIKFPGNAKINSKMIEDRELDPNKGISIDDALIWFEWVWENYEEDQFFIDKRRKDGKEWADEDLKNILVMLSGYRSPGKKNQVNGYKTLKRKDLISLHDETPKSAFEKDIVAFLREGKIVIIDLSQGNKDVQSTFSEKICTSIFNDSMNKFINTQPNNFIQFYFEEAHNLFPKKEDKDLSQIYNRLAKEGAKLNLAMTYATQEVSSISSNILKNTQNWFIAHLNNEDETKELRKYYDFEDFTNSLVRFSAKNDKGFVRMKSYSNPFIVPVQIDKFSAK